MWREVGCVGYVAKNTRKITVSYKRQFRDRWEGYEEFVVFEDRKIGITKHKGVQERKLGRMWRQKEKIEIVLPGTYQANLAEVWCINRYQDVAKAGSPEARNRQCSQRR
ncbi:hypothetical protein E1B28_000751 [Marasmius oreades]|uniref:Uncharacterized protein n=1 Tax=Marasmius oreades TaxID=181124 RepID=A0A9P8AET7_9AGAR|nr:uncharacterized protein E1B28_000751 [Marasmius oreades]KAG7098848.1 hypothetical protein E1B28_000751 [Marasmius oreades]